MQPNRLYLIGQHPSS